MGEDWKKISTTVYGSKKYIEALKSANNKISALRTGGIIKTPFIDTTETIDLSQEDLNTVIISAKELDPLVTIAVGKIANKYNLTTNKIFEILEIVYQTSMSVIENQEQIEILTGVIKRRMT